MRGRELGFFSFFIFFEMRGWEISGHGWRLDRALLGKGRDDRRGERDRVSGGREWEDSPWVDCGRGIEVKREYS